MDMTAWQWQSVERRDAPAVLTHALSLAPIRHALWLGHREMDELQPFGKPGVDPAEVIDDIRAMRVALDDVLRVPRRWSGGLRRTTQAPATGVAGLGMSGAGDAVLGGLRVIGAR